MLSVPLTSSLSDYISGEPQAIRLFLGMQTVLVYAVPVYPDPMHKLRKLRAPHLKPTRRQIDDGDM